jgi:hypothetical protein
LRHPQKIHFEKKNRIERRKKLAVTEGTGFHFPRNFPEREKCLPRNKKQAKRKEKKRREKKGQDEEFSK